MRNTRLRYKITILIALVLLHIRFTTGALFSSASDITTGAILVAVNKERSDRNIPTLNTDSRLATAADYKAHDMINRNYFAHVDPDGHYIWDKIISDGYYPYTTLGENLAIDFSDIQGLMSAWIDSPTHRANILNTAFKDQGVGVANNNGSSDYNIAIANTFGAQPAPKSAPPKTTSPTQTPAPKTSPSSKTSTAAPKTSPPVSSGAVQKPKVATKAALKITINNTESLLHISTITIVGSGTPGADIQLVDSTQSVQSAKFTTDAAGNYVYTMREAPNGKHSLVATITKDGQSLSTPPYNFEVQYIAPQVDQNSISISPSIVGDKLNLHVSARVNDQTKNLTASVLGESFSFKSESNQYEGDIVLNKLFDLGRNEVVFTATDQYGDKTNLSYSLKQVSLPKAEDPRSLQNAVSTNQPDLYSVFKLIVMGFGGLFTLFLIADSIMVHKRKLSGGDLSSGSGIIMLLLTVSTLAVITWWH